MFNPLRHKVFVNKILPYAETVKACDVETREEINVLTGRDIHLIVINEDMHVSQQLMEDMLDRYSQANDRSNF